MADYNGWKNRATWNVNLWVNNDYDIYQSAQEYVRRTSRPTWDGFVAYAGLHGKTPDGVSWKSRALSRKELNAMLREMK